MYGAWSTMSDTLQMHTQQCACSLYKASRSCVHMVRECTCHISLQIMPNPSKGPRPRTCIWDLTTSCGYVMVDAIACTAHQPQTASFAAVIQMTQQNRDELQPVHTGVLCYKYLCRILRQDDKLKQDTTNLQNSCRPKTTSLH